MNAYKYADLIAVAARRGFSAKITGDHQGKFLSIEQDEDTGALEIYRWDDEKNSTMIGSLVPVR